MQCASGRQGAGVRGARGGAATGPHCVGMQGMRTATGLPRKSCFSFGDYILIINLCSEGIKTVVSVT